MPHMENAFKNPLENKQNYLRILTNSPVFLSYLRNTTWIGKEYILGTEGGGGEMWKNSLWTENSTAEKESLLEKYRQN